MGDGYDWDDDELQEEFPPNNTSVSTTADIPDEQPIAGFRGGFQFLRSASQVLRPPTPEPEPEPEPDGYGDNCDGYGDPDDIPPEQPRPSATFVEPQLSSPEPRQIIIPISIQTEPEKSSGSGYDEDDEEPENPLPAQFGNVLLRVSASLSLSTKPSGDEEDGYVDDITRSQLLSVAEIQIPSLRDSGSSCGNDDDNESGTSGSEQNRDDASSEDDENVLIEDGLDISRQTISKSDTTIIGSPTLSDIALSRSTSTPRVPVSLQETSTNIITKGKRADEDWNEEFQAGLDLPEGTEKWETLSRLARDFVYCSKTYGKIIISEYYLPAGEKTIKPFNAGGLAGGTKYLCSSIFFKFALDGPIPKKKPEDPDEPVRWMYGGSKPNDQAAMKAARNDMLGLLSYYNSDVKGLHYPLMSLIDYRGFRLIAMSILPINKNTIRYGSADGGKSVHCHKPLASLMKAVGKQLRLKGHRVGVNKDKIYGPADIEGHQGLDGKYYVIDFGRVFPPEVPRPKTREAFYCLLRPEFVHTYPIPLSSDGFTGFGFLDRDTNNAELREATRYLYQTTIPQFIQSRLYKLSEDDRICESIRLTEALHRAGINCRHLGLVRSAVNKDRVHLKQFLLSEILARTLNNILREMLRTEMQRSKIAAKEDPYRRVVFIFLTAVLAPPIPIPPPIPGKEELPSVAQTPASETIEIPLPTPEEIAEPYFWNFQIRCMIQKKFRRALSAEELAQNFDIRNKVKMVYVLTRLCQQSGVKLNKHALDEYASAPTSFKLMKFDLQKISARVRHMNVIDEAEANILFTEAKSRATVRDALWKATSQKFARAVASNTNSVRTFLKWGTMLITQCSMLPFDIKNYCHDATNLLDEALEKFEAAETLNSNVWEIYYQKAEIFVIRAVVLHLFSTVDTIAISQWYVTQASEEFNRAFQLAPHSFHQVIDSATELYESALRIQPQLMQLNFEETPEFKKKTFLLLKGFYYLLACFKVAPVTPDATAFFLAGTILYEYIQSNGPNQGSHVGAAAGSLFECAMLLSASAADANFTYAFPNSRYNPFELYQKLSNSCRVEIYQKKKDPLTDFELCEFQRVVDISTRPSFLHFVPWIGVTPIDNYQQNLFINRLFNILGCHRIEEGRHWELSMDSFVLYVSTYNNFLLSEVVLGVPETNYPVRMHLLGSQTPDTEVNFKDLRSLRGSMLRTPGLSSPSLGASSHHIKTQAQTHYYGCFDIVPGSNSFTITSSYHAKYLIVKFDAEGDNKKILNIYHMDFLGFQVPRSTGEESSLGLKGSIPEIEYRPQVVSWVRQQGTSPKITIGHNSTITVRETKIDSLRTRLTTNSTGHCIIRATPALTLKWSPDRAQTRKKIKRYNPILLWVGSDVDSNQNQSILVAAKQAYKQKRKLQIYTMVSLSELRAWLDEADPLLISRLAKHGLIRIVTSTSRDHPNADIIKHVVNLVKSDSAWRKIFILVFCSSGDSSSASTLRNEQNLVWVTTNPRVVIDFIVMNFTSQGVNFDISCLYQGETIAEDHIQPARTLTNVVKPKFLFSRVQEEIFSQSFPNLKVELPSNESETQLVQSGSDRDLPYGPFLYFEIEIKKWDHHSEICIGVTPRNFPLQGSMPGFEIGSFGWFGLKGMLFVGREDKGCAFHPNETYHFQQGDTIGCGYEQATEQLYWTKNGKLVGVAQGGKSKIAPKSSTHLFATVGFEGSSSTVLIPNFGERPFKYDQSTFFQQQQEEQQDLRASARLVCLSPYSFSVFKDIEDKQGYSLQHIARICRYSFGLQTLLRVHLRNRYDHPVKSMKRYQQLNLSNCSTITDRGLAEIYNLFPSVYDLNLIGCQNLTANAFQNISSQNAPPLRVLNVEGIPNFDDSTAQIIANRFTGLRALRVWTHITDLGLGYLSGLVNLETLELRDCSLITDLGLQNFLTSNRRFPIKLKHLQLDRCEGLTDRALSIIYRSSTAATLEKFSIASCKFSEAKLIRFVKNTSALVALNIAGDAHSTPPYGDNLITALCKARGQQFLALNIYRCTNITSAGIVTLISRCPLLQELNVGHFTNLTPVALSTIAEIRFGNLQRVELVATSFTDQNLIMLAKNHKNLRELSVQRCKDITAYGLITAFPFLLELRYLSLKEVPVTDVIIYGIKDLLPRLKYLDIRRAVSYQCFSIFDLRLARPNLVIFDNLSSRVVADGRNIDTLVKPSAKLTSVRTRRNSL